jgi:hypothetical protein
MDSIHLSPLCSDSTERQSWVRGHRRLRNLHLHTDEEENSDERASPLPPLIRKQQFRQQFAREIGYLPKISDEDQDPDKYARKYKPFPKALIKKCPEIVSLPRHEKAPKDPLARTNGVENERPCFLCVGRGALKATHALRFLVKKDDKLTHRPIPH